jgi:hypothetical protein
MRTTKLNRGPVFSHQSVVSEFGTRSKCALVFDYRLAGGVAAVNTHLA